MLDILNRIDNKTSLNRKRLKSTTTTESTEFSYITGFRSENILAIIDTYEKDYTTKNCTVFNVEKFQDQEKPEELIRNHPALYVYQLKYIDYNLLLSLIRRSCTMKSLEQQSVNEVGEKSSDFDADDEEISSNLASILKQIDNQTTWHAPKTLWCGTDLTTTTTIMNDYWNLGPARFVDICCREHEYCSIVLRPNEKRYNLFNESLFKMYLCQCEQFFYDCLKRRIRLGKNYGDVIRNVYFKRSNLKCLQPIDCNAGWIFDNEWQ
uniref:Uncharacterized protein LOC113796987 n=1 Tax=Dermatophagoides pteronyssinus TaxID=6956 RepID=A0A6P6YCT7_DERPT